jgi:hypothetical protein
VTGKEKKKKSTSAATTLKQTKTQETSSQKEEKKKALDHLRIKRSCGVYFFSSSLLYPSMRLRCSNEIHSSVPLLISSFFFLS